MLQKRNTFIAALQQISYGVEEDEEHLTSESVFWPTFF